MIPIHRQLQCLVNWRRIQQPVTIVRASVQKLSLVSSRFVIVIVEHEKIVRFENFILSSIIRVIVSFPIKMYINTSPFFLLKFSIETSKDARNFKYFGSKTLLSRVMKKKRTSKSHLKTYHRESHDFSEERGRFENSFPSDSLSGFSPFLTFHQDRTVATAAASH